jgi:YidC/Oxa1 family membrane protein insertase
MRQLFEAILFDPLLNVFVALYNIVPDVGVVIIIITVVIKGILWPLTKKSISAQKSMTDLQPKLEDLKKQYKDDQQKLAQETMKLYSENKVNPLGSCLPILVQLPIFLAIYWVLIAGLASESFNSLYSFVQNPGEINTVAFGIIDLAKGSIILAIMAGASQYWHAKMMQRKQPPKEAGKGGKDEGMMAMMNKQMLYFMPGLTVLIGMQLPGGLSLYWFVSTLLTVVQQKQMGMGGSSKKMLSNDKKDSNVIEGKVED